MQTSAGMIARQEGHDALSTLERVRYLEHVETLRRRLEPWQGGNAVVVGYRHAAVNSAFLNDDSENSVLEIVLTKEGIEGEGRLRCMACLEVMFLALWVTADVRVTYRPNGLAPLFVTDGLRLRVACIDAEVT
jgi:hypothetical protein